MILLDDKNVNSGTRQLLCNSSTLLFIYTDKSVSAFNTHTKRYRQATGTPYKFTKYSMFL